MLTRKTDGVMFEKTRAIDRRRVPREPQDMLIQCFASC